MAATNEQTTMICLFHSQDQADAAVRELVEAGFAKDAIGVMGNSGTAAANPVAMEKWKVPERDASMLTEGMNKGGIVVAVSAVATAAADKAEAIFSRHQASQVDEAYVEQKQAKVPASYAEPAQTGTIDVIEEQMTVGKRAVQKGGVRVFQRIIEKPVSEDITLREEHVSVERHAVNRPITSADTSAFKDQSIELRETAEEAVVSKSARVVEEVLVGKTVSEHVETVKGKVRKTDVTVERVDSQADLAKTGNGKSYAKETL